MSNEVDTTAAELTGTAFYGELARRATERALANMATEDVGAELSLASIAQAAVMGMATEHELADLSEYVLTDDDGYALDDGTTCICPPDMLARGGFKGSCPIHSSRFA